MKKELKIILLTALLEIVGLGIIIPIMPFVIKGFGFGSQWVGFSFAISSVGMFFGGLVFGRLSDKYGRKKILSYTVLLNVIGYSLFMIAGNIYIFLFARLISGIASAGIGVAQAYISDISKPSERTKNMGLIGAMFGVGFILGPVIGALFSGYSLQFLGGVSAFILFVNALVIWFLLPESKKCIKTAEKDETINPIDFHHHKKQLQVLFLTSFGVALGFSANQSILPLFLNDKFNISEKHIGYVFGLIGAVAVIYQAFLIKYVRNALKEKGLVIFGIILMTIVFIIFGLNNSLILALILVIFFPVAYGSVNPGINSLIAKYAENETGKAMGTNVSYISIANIIGPLLAGYSYIIGFGMPYLISCIFFIVTLGLFYKYIK
ncbi:MAG: MFS transporter [Candidatus Gracilibacteria bacterium]|nr:MFS transporter [Candidatus Gracilibacteria bacterium]MDD2908460.1 MFS transporter [Candidatus Gracilibacteria bacterium]